MAIWSEGSTHYLMANVNDDHDYRCFTFEEAMNQDHLFTMAQAENEVCQDLWDHKPRALYRIFGESKGSVVYSTWLSWIIHFHRWSSQQE